MLMVSLGACHNHNHDHKHDQDHDHSHEGHFHDDEEDDHDEDNTLLYPNAIKFSKQQAGKIDFKIEHPIVQPFGQVIKTTAQILSSQDDEMIIVSRASGIISFSGKPVTEGNVVNAGQQLFSVSSSGMAENNLGVQFTEAQSNYLKAEADYKRSLDLYKEKIISEKDFLSVKSEYETSKAAYDNLQQNFSSKGQQVSSPQTGYIKQLFVGNGQFVEAGQPLVSISKNKSLLVKADVQIKYASMLPYIASANITSPDKKTIYSLEDLNGKVLSFGRSISEENTQLPVTFQIDNKAGFIPGSFVELFIKTKSDKPVLTIPNTALTEEQGIFFVYTEIAPELFEKREVKTGMTDGILTEIISGLSDNEKVVTKGAISVKLAQASGALDPHAGHVH